LKKYGFLADVIKREFGTLGIFSRESTIPKTTLSLLINGKYGSNETKAIKRVNEKIRELRPRLDLSHIWDPSYTWYQKYIQDEAIIKSGFKIIVDVRLNGEGQLVIAPIVEGY
jgi:hypothetical protein